MRKYFRLLPVVVLVGTGLLAIKGVDIARAAQAVNDPDSPDNSGLAPGAGGGTPATPDFANPPDADGSASEVDVLSSLTQRRAELDARERALAMRENLLKAGEARVDQKVVALKQLEGDITALLAKRDQAQDDQIKSLIKTYSAMKPKDAARIFNTLSDDVLLPVARGMKSDVLAPVLSAMNPDAAQKLTVKLANLLKLPDTAAGTMCPVPGENAAAPAPGATAAAAPLPEMAALSPPGVTPVVMPAAPPPAAPTVTPAAAPAPPSTPPQAAAPPAAKPATPPKPRKVATTPPPEKPATAPKPLAASATPPAATAPATPAATAPATTTPAAPAPSQPTPPKPEAATAAPPGKPGG